MMCPIRFSAGNPRPGRSPLRRRPRGFALIVTLSLMILLVVVAVGLLTLSTITLRSAGQGKSMAEARSNARLALMLAIGDLQKAAGPDQRVTARADVIDGNNANPRLTGVWKSRKIDGAALPTPQDYQKTARDAAFLGWLASSVDGKAAAQVGYASSITASPVTLWGKGSLGANPKPADIVTAAKVPTSPTRGALAWAVMDEGVKVRVNTSYNDDAQTQGMKTTQLGTGVNPSTAWIPTLEKLERKYFEKDSEKQEEIAKGVSRLSFGLAADKIFPGSGELLKPLGHDVSMSSTGILTDTADGGLKEDFQLLANKANLPGSYAGKGIYESRLGMSPAEAVSDPRWESFQQYASLYRDKVRNSGGQPWVRSQVPAGWTASTGSASTGVPGVVQRQPPHGVILMPTIAKVQVLFSLLARDIYSYGGGAGATIPENAAQLHGPWADNFRNSSYDYLLHLLYTPVVTLHNPYNVAIEFTNLKVVFSNVPFALQVYRNGQAQTTALAPLDQMYHQTAEQGKLNKRFGMTLKTKTFTGAAGSSTFKLLPGEVKMFTPYIPPNRSWAEENSGTRLFSDWDNDPNRAFNIDGIPGWRGDGIGFDLDWFCPQPLRVSQFENENNKNMDRGGCIGMRRQDEFHVLFAPLSVPDLSKNKFVVEMFASSGTSATAVSSGAIEMDYESPTGLQDFLISKNGTLRYPKDGTLNTLALLDHSSSPIKKYTKVKPFALLSARAKTTSGGRDSSNEDGRLATKPWSFAHANIGAVSEKIASEHPANHSHEIDLQLLEGGTANLLQVDAQDRGNFISGNTGFNGTKFGIQYEIPLAPLQTLSSLNGANPGGSSGYLPRFAQPVGNSWAHPLMSTDKALESGNNGNLLDHSFLLNSALYDHFYFSGLAEQDGEFFSGKPTTELSADFAKGEPLADPRLVLYRPGGSPPEELATDTEADDAPGRIAAWQMMEGAFNINSTSVNAWKAMLGSIRDPRAVVNLINKGNNSCSFTELSATGDNEGRISRFRLPASESEQDGGDVKDGYWMGPREYEEADLQKLAENIVKQVRLRGPFLSLSEFVNRRLGPASDEMSQRGALQQAIDDSELNESFANDANAGYDIGSSAVADYRYKNPEAGTGSSFQGAPGYLTQADILAVLGNAATPRSDTFTIRGYGEARDASNKVTASATCEAVVQRVPDYVDSIDHAKTAPAELESIANVKFGRRFNIVSFRWLHPSEI